MGFRGCLLLCCNLSALLAARAAAAQTMAVPPASATAQTPATPPRPGTAKSDAGARAAPVRQDTKAAGAEIGETIVVTATRRRDTIQQTPAAITAFTDERRNLIGVQNGQDFVNLTPSASLEGEYLTIRGVGRFEDPGQGTDPGVGVTLDGVYTASPAYLGQPDFLTDRVEILRGPQQITGRESAGGDINIYSRRPTDQYHADIRFGGTSFDEGYSDAAISGPITDNLKFRLSEAYDVTGGSNQDNIAADASGRDRQPGRGDSLILEGQVEWDPTDDLNIWARYQNFQQHYNQFYGDGAGVGMDSPYLGGPGHTIASPLFFGLAPNPQFGLQPNSNPSLSDPFKTDLNTIGHSDIHDDHTFTINATYDLHDAVLKYIGGYSQYVTQNSADVDSNSRSFVNVGGRQVAVSYVEDSPAQKHWYSNELSLSSRGADRFRWVVGAYQYGEDYVTGFNINDPLATYLAHPLNGTTFAPVAANPQKSIYAQTTSLATNDEAVYGQIDYDITPTIRASGSFRYNWDQRFGSDSFRYVYDLYGISGLSGFTRPTGLDFTPAVDTGSAAQSYQNQTGKAGLEWHPNKSLIAYASVSRGYEPGGFNLGNFAKIPQVSSETLMDYEAGVKKTWGSFLLLDASGYYYQYNDLQVPVYTTETGPRGAVVFAQNLVNAQRARSYGAELETVVSPTADLHLTFLYSYLNAAFEEFQNPIDGQRLADISTGTTYASLRGNPIPFSPRNKFTFSPQYTVHLPRGDLSLSAIYSYVGSQFDGVFKNQNYRTPQYENLNLRALYQPTKTKWTFILFARNVTNSTQFVYHAPSIFYPSQTAYTVNPPFVFGGEVQYRF